MRQINTRFFLILAGSLVLLAGCFFGVHYLQAGNIAGALLWQAEQAEQAGKLDAACRYLDRYLSFVPDDLDRRAHLAALLADPKLATTPKNQRRARNVIEQVLARDPQRHELRQALCRLALEGRDFELAKEHLGHLERGRPDSAHVALLQGRYHELQNQPQHAADHYRRVLKLDPDHVAAHVKLAELLRQLDFGKEARHADEIARLVEGALKKAPNDPAVLGLAARQAQAKGDVAAAQKYLESGLAQAPTDARLYVALAGLHSQSGRRGEAIATLRRALRTVPKAEHAQLQWSLTNHLLDDNQLDEARKVIAEIRDALPYWAEFLDARRQMAQGRWYEAAAAMEKMRPGLKGAKEIAATVDQYLAECYDKLDEPAKRLAAYLRAAELNGTSLPVRLGLARAHQAVGNADEALRLYQDVIRASTNRQDAAHVEIEYAHLYLALAISRGHRDMLPAVERMADAAGQDIPDSVELADLRARLCLARGQSEQAETILRRAAAAAPGRHEPWVTLASVRSIRRQHQQADAVLAEAVGRLEDTADFRAARAEYWARYRPSEAPAQLEALEKGLDRFDEAGRARLMERLARGQESLGRLAEAGRLLRQVADLPRHAEDVRVRSQLLGLALRQGDEAGMRRALDEIKAVEGDSPAEWCYGEALRLIWNAWRGKADGLEEARALLTRAAARRPDWHPVLVARAEIDELQTKHEQAIANYRKALELGNREAQTLRRLVTLLTKAQRFEEAEQEIRKMQQADAAADLRDLAIDVAFSRKDVKTSQVARQLVRADSPDFRDHLWLGQVFSARGQASDDAEKAFRKAVALGEKQPEAWVGLVRYLVGTGQMAKANKEIQNAAAALGEDARPLALAQCHEMIGQLPQALEHYQESLRRHPQSALVHRAAADFYVRVGRLRDAETIYRKIAGREIQGADEDAVAARHGLALAIAKSGNSARLGEALGIVGLTLDDKGQVGGTLASQPEEQLAQARVLATAGHHALRAKAIAVLEALHQKQALHAEDQHLLARLLHQHGSDAATWAKTRDVLKGLTTTYPNHPRYLGYFANLLLLRKDVADAEPLVARLEQVEKDRKLPVGTLGSVELSARALELRGREQQAVALLKQFAAQEQTPGARTFLLASLHGRLGNFAEAVDLCEQVQRAGRRDEAFGVAVGILRGNRPEAAAKERHDRWQAQVARVEQALRDAAQRDSENLPLRLQLADLLELQGKFDEVDAVCRQVLAQDATNLVALNNLAWLLAHRPGKAEEALELINRALDKYGPRPELLDTRALAYLTLGQHDRSVRDLEKVVLESPTPTHLFHLSRAHHQARDNRLALAALQRANDLGLNVQLLHPTEHDAYRRVVEELQPR